MSAARGSVAAAAAAVVARPTRAIVVATAASAAAACFDISALAHFGEIRELARVGFIETSRNHPHSPWGAIDESANCWALPVEGRDGTSESREGEYGTSESGEGTTSPRSLAKPFSQS